MNTPSGWATTTLGEIAAEPVEQQAPKGSSFTYVDISSIDKATKRIASPQQLETGAAPSRAKQHLHADDVLVSMTRPNLNAVARVPNELHGSTGSTGFCVLRSSYVSPRWLEYRVQAHDFIDAMSGLVQGALYPAVRPRDVLGFSTLLPPRQEQDRIADEIEKQFTRLDDAVAALKRVQANLKRYRASVLKAACEGRLVPTEAELARKESRSYEPASELLKRILAERRAKWEADQLEKMITAGKPPQNDEWKKTYREPESPGLPALPTLPEGWTWATLDQLSVFITSGSRGWKEFYSPQGAMFIRSQDIRTDQLLLAGVAHVSPPQKSEGSRTRVYSGDILVTITGANVAKAAVVKIHLDEAYVSQHVGLIRLVDQQIDDVVHAYLISPSGGRKILLKLAYGAGKPGLNLDNLRSLPIPTPRARASTDSGISRSSPGCIGTLRIRAVP